MLIRIERHYYQRSDKSYFEAYLFEGESQTHKYKGQCYFADSLLVSSAIQNNMSMQLMKELIFQRLETSLIQKLNTDVRKSNEMRPQC